jgi:hypothetical protein
MDAKILTEAHWKRKKTKGKKGGTPRFQPTIGFGSRKFIGAYAPGRAYGPAFPMGFGWGEMSSVPGGPCGDGTVAADASGAMEAAEGVANDDEDLMISDRDKLIYALRGIIENAKVAYEAVTGVPYDEEDDVPEKKDEEPSEQEEPDEVEYDDDDGPDEDGSDDN